MREAGYLNGSASNEVSVNSNSDLLLKTLQGVIRSQNALIETQNTLSNKLDTPFKSYTLLSDISAQQEIFDRIINETTIKRNP